MIVKRNNFFRFIVLLIAVCCFPFAFVSCDADAQKSDPAPEQESSQDDIMSEYDTVELTTKNYGEYLTISIEITNSDIEYIGQDALGLDKYLLSFVGTIKPSKKGNFKFENASIFCSVTIPGWSEGMISANIELDYEGKGVYSIHFSKKSSSNKFNLKSSDCTISVYGAKGNVRIYD